MHTHVHVYTCKQQINYQHKIIFSLLVLQDMYMYVSVHVDLPENHDCLHYM